MLVQLRHAAPGVECNKLAVFFDCFASDTGFWLVRCICRFEVWQRYAWYDEIYAEQLIAGGEKQRKSELNDRLTHGLLVPRLEA